MQEDAIVDIPPNRIRYFGGPGKMLLPSPATIAALIKKIPERRLITTSLLREELTEQFEVEGTCPITTQNSLQAVAYDTSDSVAYWRVIKANGTLMTKFPGGVAGHAARLREEGFAIDESRKTPMVINFQDCLVRFD
jgi:hypothetical protein